MCRPRGGSLKVRNVFTWKIDGGRLAGLGGRQGIHPVATVYSQPRDEIRYSAGAQARGGNGFVERLKKHTFLYTWQDIHIFAKLRGINLSDTAHVKCKPLCGCKAGICRYGDWCTRLVQPDKVKVILVHGETGEVVMDSDEWQILERWGV